MISLRSLRSGEATGPHWKLLGRMMCSSAASPRYPAISSQKNSTSSSKDPPPGTNQSNPAPASSSGDPVTGRNQSIAAPAPAPAPAPKDHTPSYCFPPGQHPSRLKASLYNYKYEIFKSPTKTGIFGHRVGPARIHAPHRMARKARNAPLAKRESLPWEVRSLMRSHENSKRRKPNMASNVLPIGGGAHAPNLALKLLQTVDVSEMVRSVLLGSLLGHGNLFVDRDKYPDAAVLFFRNHAMNKDYFDWKAEQFKEMAFEHSFGTRADKLEFRTVPVPEFRDFHHMTCWKNHTVVKRKWLNHMTPVSLAVWWCDRGSIIARGTKGRIILDKFDKQSVEMIQKYLKVMWKVEAEVVCLHRADRLWGRSRVEKWYYRLHLRTPQLKIFLRIIMGYIPVPGMIKKTVVIHDSVSKQKAWVEEMKAAMPQWSEEIDAEVARQKSARESVREMARRREWEVMNKASLDAGGKGCELSDVPLRRTRWYADRRSRSEWKGATKMDQTGASGEDAAKKTLRMNSRKLGVRSEAPEVKVGHAKLDQTVSKAKVDKFDQDSLKKRRSDKEKFNQKKPEGGEVKARGVEITRLYNIFTNRDEKAAVAA